MKTQGKFFHALWNEGRAQLMGGSLSAIVVIVGMATGKQVIGVAAWILLALIFLHGAANAWSKEHERAESLARDVDEFTNLKPRIEITEYESLGSPFALHVDLVNPGVEPVGFEKDWLVDVTLADGRKFLDGVGYLDGEITSLKQGERFKCSIFFPRPFMNAAAYLKLERPTSATFRLRARDFSGRTIEATWKHP